MKSSLAILLLIVLLLPVPAHAYLDAGSGSMVLQLLVAGFAGVLVGIKVFWRRMVAFFSRPKNPPRSS